nr:hypothetical protein [Tanacetum cinerariifolium]
MYRNNKFWWKKDSLVIPRGLAWSKIGNFEKGDYGALFAECMDYFQTSLVDGQPNGPITASPKGIQPIICAAVVHDPQFEQQPKEVVELLPLFTSEELVAEYHSITTSVQLIENVGDGDPLIFLKELAAVKQDSAISNVLIGEISCQNLVKEQLQSRDMCIQSITNQIVRHPLESPKGKRTESSISDVFHSELSVVETSKSKALSEEFDPKEYDKNVDDSGVGKSSESEIINVLTGQVSCDKNVSGFYECESSKLYYTNPKEYSSSSMTQLLQAAVPEQTSSQMLAYTSVDLNLPNLNQSFTESQVNDYAEFDFDNPENYSLSIMVKTREEEIHLDGLEIVDDPFVHTPYNQNYEEMSMYVNEVNVVNENQPPSSEKVVRQLIRKRFVGKDLVEPYTVQPPTNAPSAFLKVDRKRLKRKARLLQIQNTRILFDDDDPNSKVLSLEEWESTKLKKKQNKKEPIKQSQIDLKEIPLVEFHEDFSRAPYSRRTKVKLPECVDMVYALSDDTSHIFPWGNNDIFVYRYFCLNLLGWKEGGWLSDRPALIFAVLLCGEIFLDGSVMELRIPLCGQTWNRTNVITLYDSLFSEAVETRKWWIKMRKAFKKYIPSYLQEWGILDAKGIPRESYNITFVVGKDVPIQGDAYGDCEVWVCIFLYRLIHKMEVYAKDPQIVGLAYREHMFDYFWNLYYKCGLEVFEVKDEDDVQFFVNEVCGKSEIVQKLCVKKIKEHKQVKVVVPPVNDFDLNVSLFPNDYNDQTDNLPKWQLSYYCYNLKLANEGTVTHIHTDADGRFEMLYVGFGFPIRSFLRYMRPLIIIDGAHLKGNYLGNNLLAVRMDGNNQIIPLATDRHAAIIQACATVFDNSFHGFYDRHLMMNCNLKGKKLRGIFWKACKAYTMEDFDKEISELRGHRPEVVRKLEEEGFEKWSRVYCPKSRYNYMTSNSVKSINSLTMIVRRVLITMLVEYCRDLLQRWYCEKRHKYEEAPENKLCDWAGAKVYDKMLKSANWIFRPIDHLKLFQVFNKLEPNQRRKSVRTNSLIRTPTREEHLSKEARLDEERLGNGRVYMDWDDVQASEEPVTTEGMAVETGN